MCVLFALDAVTTFYSIWEHLGFHSKIGFTTSVMCVVLFLTVNGKSNFSEIWGSKILDIHMKNGHQKSHNECHTQFAMIYI